MSTEDKQFKQSKLSLAEYEYLPEKISSDRNSKKPRIPKSQSLIDFLPSAKARQKCSAVDSNDTESNQRRRQDLSQI